MIQFYSYFHDLSSRKRGSPEKTALTITNEGFRQTLTPPAALNHLLTKITGIGGANKRLGAPWRGRYRSGRESRITRDRRAIELWRPKPGKPAMRRESRWRKRGIIGASRRPRPMPCTLS